jgi:prophage regulatory protein
MTNPRLEVASTITTDRKARPRPERQPVDVLNLPDALLTIRTVCSVIGMSESSLRRAVRAGDFPQPIRRGTRCTRFISAHVSAWLRAQQVQS